MSNIIKLLLLISIFTSFSCEKDKTQQFNYAKNGGIVISFDDRSINEWYLADSLLKKFNWKATFCVTNIDKCSANEIKKLHTLQNEGHEIAGHGFKHLNQVEFLSKNGTNEYLNSEIIPMLNFFEYESFNCSSFAYPYGIRNGETDKILMDYFKIIRGTTYGKIDPSIHSCFFNNSRLVFSIGIDNPNDQLNEKYILDLLSYAKESKKILIMSCHKPVENVTSDYQVSISTLYLICEYIEENGMDFFTLKDLYKMIN